MSHYIFNSTGGFLSYTGFPGDTSAKQTLEGLPLTTVDGGSTGLLGVVVSIGGSASGGQSSPFFVSGAPTDDSPGTTLVLEVGGKAVDAASYAPAYTAGDAAMFAFSDSSGGLLSHIRQINQTDDSINADPTQHSTASNFALATTGGTVFTLAAGERGFIQNCQTAALAVKYGTAAATNSFSMVLNAGTAVSDGNGGMVQIDNWIGPVSVITMAGSAANYIAWKVS